MAGPGKRIVLTGVSRGLGRAMTAEFAARGHVVAGCARSTAAVDELRRQLGPPHVFDVVDVSRDDDVHSWAGRILEALGPPDVLVNNAAVINANAPLWAVSDAELARVLDVNIRGVVNTIRHFVPAMIARGSGVIVNFSSYWGRSAAADVGPYCASKFAVEGLTQALAQELPAGLAAVALNPGIINTAMLQSCFGDEAGRYLAPAEWARQAVPFILQLGRKDNGQPLTVPGQ